MPTPNCLRIGFDGGVLANCRGFGRFARELLRALADLHTMHQLVVIVDEPSLRSGGIHVPAGTEVVSVPVRVSPSRAASSQGRRAVRDMLAMGRAAAAAKLDTFLFPTSYGFYPVWNVGPIVTTIFDTMPLDFPELIFTRGRQRWAWGMKERLAVWRSSAVLTSSEYSKRSIRRHYALSDDDVHVIPCAPSDVFRPIDDRERIDDVVTKYCINPASPYFLYVGGLSPHKNLLRLIDSFAQLDDTRIQLVLVGDLDDVFHTHVPELRARVATRSLEGRVFFPGFVPDGELVCLYNAALALVQPSLIEGFGLPPVEAMACGTPVIASTAGSLPEVVGDAGLSFEPTDVDGLTMAMQSLVDDSSLRQQLALRAAVRAGRYRWSDTARLAMDVLTSVAAQPRISAA